MVASQRPLLASRLALLAVGPLVSCQSATPVPSALHSGHWQQVHKNPPTYFPLGVPADHPTSVHDGYWVSAGDELETRFFIPSHGTELRPKILIAEAHAAMTPAAQKQRKRREWLSDWQWFYAGDG